MRNRSIDGRVCESFYAEDIDSAFRALEQIDCLGELRFDLSQLQIKDIKKIREKSIKKLIFTCRGEKISKENLTKIYEEAIKVGFDYIDIDFNEDGDILSELELQLAQSTTLLILSYHNYHETPGLKNLEPIVSLLFSSQADLIKIACLANTKEDVSILLQLQKQFENTICLAMGKFATESRIKSLKAGGLFTFVALQPEKSTAPGQLNYHQFEQAFTQFRGVEKIKLAVLGNPISHSKSPDLFKSFFEEHRVNGVYEKIELGNINEFEELKEHFNGFNITAPFKQSIIPYLDELSEAAQKIGAVNTVYQMNGKWLGDNTDYVGITNSIKTLKQLEEIQNCLIIGAGGAARAALYALQQKNIKVSIINRTHLKAQALAEEFEVTVLKYVQLKNFDLIINTIPQPFNLINPEELSIKHCILDAIYPVSVFEKQRETLGFKLIKGEVWLEAQALESMRIFQ